ncbi:MAG: AhpC/TSA family protein [Filimonas sp.]|nr:AhpC/TSA family protein [Filimonas sp.]
MRSFFLLIVVSLFLLSNVAAQSSRSFAFKITGTINADSGTIRLMLIADSNYYPKEMRNVTAAVVNKRFVLTGSLPYPQGVQLLYNDKYITDVFVITKGDQSVTYDIFSRELPIIQNEVTKEQEDCIAAFEKVNYTRRMYNQKYDSLRAVYNNQMPDSTKLHLEEELNAYYRESDRTLLDYVMKHPDSYVAFWKFIRLLPFGYENIFDSIYANFSPSLRNTYAGRELSKNLTIAGKLNIGKSFPAISCSDIQYRKFTANAFSKNKYTLVDFWYSYCEPCRAQFGDLKDLFEEYKDKGFGIIGISTDKVKDEKNWVNTINKYQLLWPQYWDKNGKEANRLLITAFPTNFLIDREGRIVQKNLRPIELKEFLRTNLE